MILDSIQNRDFYQHIGSGIAEALEYLATADFSKMPDGKHELDGQRHVCRLCSVTAPNRWPRSFGNRIANTSTCNIVAGAERMGCVALSDSLPVKQPYDPKLDAAFYNAQGDLFTVSQGNFAIFAPHNVHAPGLALDPPHAAEVLKVVVKCLVKQE